MVRDEQRQRRCEQAQGRGEASGRGARPSPANVSEPKGSHVKIIEDRAAKRERWLTALRSGEFLQGRGVLINAASEVPEYCCIGVYCALVPELDSSILEDLRTLKYFNQHFGYDHFGADLGFGGKEATYLTAMNDARTRGGRKTAKRRDFKFIARWAEIVFALKEMDTA